MVVAREEGLLFERFSGKLTCDLLLSAIQRSFEHSDWRPDLNVLCDLRAADLSFSYDEMAAVIAGYLPEDKCKELAFIVRRDMEYGMVRMFASL